MAQRKTQLTGASVEAFIDSIKDESKRETCRAIMELMSTVTGQDARMWGTSIIGFGTRHYFYANGKAAEICKVGFAPRARSFAFYLPKFKEHATLVEKLGRHKYSGGCLHLTSLDGVNVDVLATMIERAHRSGAEDKT